MDYTEGDSDLSGDQNIKNQFGNTPKQQPQGGGTQYEQTQKQQKTERTIGTKQFKQANSLWTNHQPVNDENIPDLMQDSEDVGTQAQTNSNLNLNIQNRVNTIGGGGVQNQRNQQQFYITNNSLQTGQFRQLIPYNGSSLMNVPPTASFSPGANDENLVNNTYQNQIGKYTSEDQVLIYQEGVTGRLPAKIRCKNCDQIIQTIVKFEPGETTNICSIVLCFLTCTLCCFPYLLDQCKDAVHYCPNCGFVVGVKKF